MNSLFRIEILVMKDSYIILLNHQYIKLVLFRNLLLKYCSLFESYCNSEYMLQVHSKNKSFLIKTKKRG